MADVRLSNTTLHYEFVGSGEPIILIPGLGGDHSAWQRQISDYSREFHCITVDNRGTGQSSLCEGDFGPDDYSLQLLASDLLELMNALHVERAHVVGSSMGGIIAILFAISYPEKVKTLSLHSTLARSTALFSLHLRTQITLLDKLSLNELLVSLAPLIWSEETLRDRLSLIQEYRDQRTNSAPTITSDVYRMQARACLEFDFLGRIHKLSMPVLVTTGSDDLLVAPSNSRLIHASIPHSELLEFEGCGHAPLVEKHQDFNAKTLAFLSRHKGVSI